MCRSWWRSFFEATAEIFLAQKQRNKKDLNLYLGLGVEKAQKQRNKKDLNLYLGLGVEKYDGQASSPYLQSFLANF